VGNVLGLDSERIVDKHLVGILQFLPPCPVKAVVDGKSDGISGYYRIRSCIVYISGRKSFDEEFSQFLKMIKGLRKFWIWEFGIWI
jgi:hypothetical protein